MRILVVGGGGREHALGWTIKKDKRVKSLFFAPGNGGTLSIGENVSISPDNKEEIVRWSAENGIDLVVVGPEAPLVGGLSDMLRDKNIPCFGPGKDGATLEGSKAFSKVLMAEEGIPTADFEVFDDPKKAKLFIKDKKPPIVVKADGLAAGKGVVVAETKEEALDAIERIMEKKVFGEAGKKVVIEEFLDGEEASHISITDGKSYLPLASSQDHKRVFDGDRGPNTGGMGAYSPAPVLEPIMEKVEGRILKPLIKALKKRNIEYRGVIYLGLMVVDGEPYVLEINCRFGDPETQPIVFRLDESLLEPILQAASGDLNLRNLAWKPGYSVCVVMASGGYPGSYEKGKPIEGLDDVEKMEDIYIFHAGTARKDGRVYTSGGRVLGVTSYAETLKGAIDKCYSAVSKIRFDGCHYRKDIGAKGLKRLGG